MKKALICVVDDEVELTEFYQSILEEDYEVATYNNPDQLIESLKNKTQIVPDLIITDYMMPQMNGLQMIKKIQDEGFYSPFIIVSGFLNLQTVLEAVDVGVFRLLEKPCSYDILIGAIDQLLLEGEALKVRMRIRERIEQLKELYSTMRLLMFQHMPKEIVDQMVEVDSAGNKVDFDELMTGLEAELSSLLENEKILDGVRKNRFRAP